MSFNTISNKLKTVLDGITDLESVYEYPWLKFDGYPSATITPSGYDSDYETNTENQRLYVYTIRLFVGLKSVNKVSYKDKVDTGHRIMRELTDKVIDVFDKDELLSGIDLPTGYTMIGVKPVPSSIVYFPDEKMIVSEVKVEVKISFDTNS